MVSKTSDVRVHSRRPRARHDVGVEPFDWFRIGLVLTLAVVASGGGLVAAGLLRQGPLRDIGWTDRRLERFYVERPSRDSYVIGVGAAVPASSCTLEVTVEVFETSDEVLVGPVHGRQPRLPITAPECEDGGARYLGRVYGVARLSRPLGDREVLDARTRGAVRVVVPRAEVDDEPSTAPSTAPGTAPGTAPHGSGRRDRGRGRPAAGGRPVGRHVLG